jgi:hypothetical protein
VHYKALQVLGILVFWCITNAVKLHSHVSSITTFFPSNLSSTPTMIVLHKAVLAHALLKMTSDTVLQRRQGRFPSCIEADSPQRI